MPYAAAAPMAGAPRTFMVRIASATSPTVRHSIIRSYVRQGGLIDQPHGMVLVLDGAHRRWLAF